MEISLIGPEQEENLSIRYLSSSLTSAGYSTVLIDYQRKRDIPKVIKACRFSDIVGISLCFQTKAAPLLDLALQIRRRYPETLIVAGGHFASCAAKELLTRFSQLDIICIHEGEQSIVEIADNVKNGHSDFDQIKGIVYRKENKIHYTPRRKILEDLDTLPYPDRQGPVRLVAGVPTAAFIGSRGCRYNCDYCCISTLHKLALGKPFRQRDPMLIGNEMGELYHQRGIRQFIFHDDNFLVTSESENLNRLMLLQRSLEINGVKDVGIFITSRPDSVTINVLKKLKELGLIRLFLGIESSTAEGYSSLGRSQNVNTAEQTIIMCNELGISVQYTILIFHPEATLKSIYSDLEFLKRHSNNSLNFVRAEAHAGTPLEARMMRNGCLRGNFMGHGYSLEDPLADLICRNWILIFNHRCGDTKGLMNITVRLGHLSDILRFYIGDDRSVELAKENLTFIQKVNLDSLELLSELINICVTSAEKKRANLKKIIDRLRQKELRSRKKLIEECQQKVKRTEDFALSCVGLEEKNNKIKESKNHNRIVTRHLAGVSMAIQLLGVVPMLAASEQAEEPLDVDYDGLYDYLENSFFGTSAKRQDSNQDGISDPLEDHDGDGLSNEIEQKNLDLLARAVWNGNITEVQKLIKDGTDMNFYHPYWQEPPLSIAAQEGNIKIVKILLENGADVEVKDHNNRTPLMHALEGRTENILILINLLFEYGASVKKMQYSSAFQIFWSKLDNPEIAQKLIDVGVDVNAIEENYNTNALHRAISWNNTEMAIILIKAGINLNARDIYGRTPLNYAAYFGSLNIIELLISAGASLEIRDNSGNSPLDIAIIKDQMEAAQLLEEYQKKTDD